MKLGRGATGEWGGGGDISCKPATLIGGPEIHRIKKLYLGVDKEA